MCKFHFIADMIAHTVLIALGAASIVSVLPL